MTSNSSTSQKLFGTIEAEYQAGLFNKYRQDFLATKGSWLKTEYFNWKDHKGEITLTGEQVLGRLANTIDSLMVRCCYDITEFIQVYGQLNEEIFPQVISRKTEKNFPILKWNFRNEKLLIKHSSLARNIIINTDSIIECIYLYSFFPFFKSLPEELTLFTPGAMANTLKRNTADVNFEFKDPKITNFFQSIYEPFSKWDKKNRNLRNYLVHMTDLHTVVYSERGVVTAAFCCAFNDVNPIDDDLKLVMYEDISQSHLKMTEFANAILRWYRSF